MIRVVTAIGLLALSLGSDPASQPATSPTYLFEPGKKLYHERSCKYIKKANNAEQATPDVIKQEKLKPCIMCTGRSKRHSIAENRKGNVDKWGIAKRANEGPAQEKDIPQIRLDWFSVRDKGQLQWPGGHGPYGPHGFRIVSVLGKNEMLILAHRETLWVKGLSTEGLDAGQVVELPQVFRIGSKERIERRTRSGGGITRYRIEKMTPNGPVWRIIVRRNPKHTETKVLGAYYVARLSSGSRRVAVWPEIAISSLQPGDVGRIVDSYNTHRDVEFRVQRVISHGEVMVRGGNRLLLIKGIPTSNMVRNGKHWLTGIFKVTGTKAYQTAIGRANTIPTLEFLGYGIDCLKTGATSDGKS